MPKKSSESNYIVEFPLSATSADIKEVQVRFSFLRQLYNTVLSQLFKDYNRLIIDPVYKQAIADYRSLKKTLDRLEKIEKIDKLSAQQKKNKKNTTIWLKSAQQTLRELNSKYNLYEYFTHSEVKRHMAACCFKNHLDSHTTQKIASRAFKAFNEWRFGVRGKPRFKSWRRGIHSAEGKAKSCLRVITGCDKKPTRLEWKGLSIPLRLNKKDPSGYQTDALELIGLDQWKYCRVIERKIRGKSKLYVQVVFEGIPYIKKSQRDLFKKGKGKTVGLDHGSSTIAAVSESGALLQRINEDIAPIQKIIAKAQRNQSRRLTKANPNNYTLESQRKGRHTIITRKIKKGVRKWEKSQAYLDDARKIKEIYRLLAAKRKQSHDILANRIVGMGNTVQNEKLSHKALQKMFGKSIGSNAPSALISTIRRKAENAGGEYVDINPWQAKLSQYDHVTDTYIKKSLSDRVHFLGGEYPVQRDLYSAFLALCTEENTVSRSKAEKLWSPSVRHAIEDAEIRIIQAASTQALPSSLAARELKKLKGSQSERLASSDSSDL